MQAASLSKMGILVSSLAALAMVPGSGSAQEGKVITQWDLQTSSGSVKIIDDSIARFEKANPGYKVEHAHIQNDAYKTKLKIAFGANQPPCVFASWGGGPLREYVKAGQVVDLSNYLAKVPEYRERFAPAGFKSVTFDGKVYGVPAENTAIASRPPASSRSPSTARSMASRPKTPRWRSSSTTRKSSPSTS